MIQILTPTNKQPFQRNNNNLATIEVTGKTDNTGILKITANPNKGGTFLQVETQIVQGTFAQKITLQAGYYYLETEANSEKKGVFCAIGEVFMIIGHSFTEDYGTIAADDERIIMPDSLFHPMWEKSPYQNSGFISMKDFSLSNVKTFEHEYQVLSTIKQGIWAKLGNELIKKFDVPVCFLNAGFGGSNLEHWYKAMYGIPFEHPFIQYSKGMPYSKAKNILNTIVPKTGIRAVICIHGDNDNNHPDKALIADYYQKIISKFRTDSGIPNLPFVLSLSATNLPAWQGLIDGALLALKTIPYTTQGAEIYKFDNALRNDDKLHLNPLGETETARQLSEIIGTKEFLIKNPPFTVNNSNQPTQKNTMLEYLKTAIIFLSVASAIYFTIKNYKKWIS